MFQAKWSIGLKVEYSSFAAAHYNWLENIDTLY